MLNSTILLEGNPKGRFEEGTIDDTSTPGTLMMINPGTTDVSGRKHWIAAAPGTAGKKILVTLLLDDIQQGMTYGTAYVAGSRCRLYNPIAGEEMNVIAGVGSGTSNNFTVGQRFIIDTAFGVLIPETGSPQDTIFECMQLLSGVVEDSLVWMKYLG